MSKEYDEYCGGYRQVAASDRLWGSTEGASANALERKIMFDIG